MPHSQGPEGFFRNAAQDATLEQDNAIFWQALLNRILADAPATAINAVLDIGCHYGGLLELLAQQCRPEALLGIEPIPEARTKAATRLSGLAKRVSIVDSDAWHEIQTRSVDLVTCHEVLYLVPDLSVMMGNVASRLAKRGRAYFTLGCHSENPVWALWKPQLEAMGHQTFDHRPMDILAAGTRHGLVCSVRPLRNDGWIHYNPLVSEFAFPDVNALFAHHFRHKLLFRFVAQ